MSWKPTTATKKIINLTFTGNKFKMIFGGTGGGKTYNILPVLINYCIEFDSLEVSVVAETMPHLKKGALKDFKKIMKSLGRWNNHYWNASDKVYTFPNDSYIEFFSADNGDKLKGPRRDILYINELDRISLEAFNQLNVRTNFEVWADFNPVGHFFVYDEIFNRENCDQLRLTYKDNEQVADSVIEEIIHAKKRAQEGSTYWKNWYRVYGLGLKGQLDGACITEYSEVKGIPRDVEGNLEARLLCLGVDFGYTNDPTAIIALWKWNDGYIIDEVVYSTGMLNKDIADSMRAYIEQYGYPVETVPVYVDNAEPKSRDELKTYKINAFSCTNKYIVQGLNLINQQTNYITKRSKNLLRELGIYIWVKDQNGNATNKPQDKDNHSPDAWRYALTSYIDNPKGEYYIY